MLQQVNEFFEGVDTDTDISKVKNTTLREALNVRLINKDGQGFIVTIVGGNEQAFKLSDGFIPLGKTEYNGIAYIFSFNTTTDEGEVGTYPSPKRSGALPWDGINTVCGTGGFEHVYKPLNNFTGACNPIPGPCIRKNFRTTRFNIDCEHQIEIVARIDFDDSVNLYYCDWKNPFRVINVGFNQTGVCNDRLYYDGSFPNGVNAFADTCSHIQFSLGSIGPGGALFAGNYIFFARYTTADFNPTSFMGESNACQISSSGTGITIDGAAGNTTTDKQVIFTLSNLDVSYPFIEIAFIYYYDGTLIVKMIDELYPITGTTMTPFVITGNEPVIAFSSGNLISRKPKDDVPKTIVQIENRIWMGNLKERTGFNPDLVDFAKCIKIWWNDNKTMADKPFSSGDGVPPQGQYKEDRKTYDNTGYFRGETYPFAIVYVMNDGTETEAFPMEGYDAWLLATTNTEGIFRFPNTFQSHFRKNINTTTGTGTIHIMGVTFDTSTCVVTQWIQDNVCGFYFTRGERKPNLKYQGVVLRTFVAPFEFNAYYASEGTEHIAPTTRRIPLWDFGFTTFWPVAERKCPFLDCWDRSRSVYTTQTDDGFTIPSALAIAGKYGFYSPDHHFKQVFGSGTGGESNFVVPIGRGRIVSSITDVTDPLYYTSACMDQMSMNFIAPVAASNVCYNIREWTQADNNGYTSLFPEGATGNYDSFYFYEENTIAGFQRLYNLAFATGRYIAIDRGNTDIDPIPDLLEHYFANIYHNDPITGFNMLLIYDVKNTKYFKISNFIKMSDLPITPAMVFYRGDCFVQRTYIKQLYNPDFYPISRRSDNDEDSDEHYYTFGMIHGIVTECAVNTAMRHENLINRYFPAKDKFDFTVNDIKFESVLHNAGYNQVLSAFSAIGFDSNVPFRGVRYPTRIRHTDPYVPGAFTDGYRMSGLASFMDFDFRLGEITKLVDFQARLMSVQEYGVSYHFINERAMKESTPSAGEFVLGTGDILAQKTANISDQIGSQHQWSIVKTDYAVYGADINKRKFWRVSGEGFELISDTKKFRTRLFEIIEQGPTTGLSDHSDIIHKMKDIPVCTEGVVGAYDRKNRDIVWSFIFDKDKKYINTTVKFNEWINAFTDRYDNISPFYITINEDFFSVNPLAFPSVTNTPSNTKDVYLDDVIMTATSPPLDNRAVFYGQQYKTRVVVVSNEHSDHAKVYDQVALNTGFEAPESIAYETLLQKATQNPFKANINPNIDPKYEENFWRVPIKRADVVVINNPNYSVGSRMRGTWMKIILEWHTNKFVSLKSLITKFRVSKQ